jgi:hypothetical protein
VAAHRSGDGATRNGENRAEAPVPVHASNPETGTSGHDDSEDREILEAS